MTFYDFYDALDAELDSVISENPHDERLHKGDASTRKSFAFLIWVMQFYGKRPIYNLSITEGDDDTSCDIIFSTVDTVGKKVFYVIQAKWKTKKNCTEKLDSTAFKSTLDDFKLIYSGQKQYSTRNDNFNRQYEGLKEHLKENNYVKFIYLTLCQNNPSIAENVEQFKKTADIEIIDIERLRRDFIEVHYKNIPPTNPLEYDYNPETEKILLPIEQLEIDKNYLHVDVPFKAYTFLIRPKTIYDFFEKYKFKLFFRNIRNPLIASEYNPQILQTIQNEPDYFWYFNNGITAITRDLPRRINPTAQQIEITGFQIINGAQTVYSVYKAYKEAKNGKREDINKALLQLRLVQSVNQSFDLNITRFTNLQNPTEPRDFWANDPVQVRLQNESFTTNYWYSVKRGEFRNVPEQVKIVSNKDFLHAYMIFWGNELGLSKLEQAAWIAGINNGYYNTYFNENTKYIDLYIAYRIKELLAPKIQALGLDLSILNDVRLVLAHLFGKEFNALILDKLKFNDAAFFYKILAFIVQNNKENEPKQTTTKEIIDAIDWELILK